MSLLGYLKGFLNGTRLSEIARGYLQTALLVETDENDESYDRSYSVSDFSENAVVKAEHDCREFAADNAGLYRQIGIDDERAGGLFWLTRTGSGVTFMDNFKTGSVEMQIAKKLHTNARKYGEAHVHANDEGELDIFTG